MGEHQKHGTTKGDLGPGGEAEEDVAHVHDGGVREDVVEALLMDGDEAHDEDVPQKHVEQSLLHPFGLEALRQERQSDAEQTIETEFLQHATVQHGDRSWRGSIGGSGPGMQREEGNQRAEAEQKHEGHGGLLRGRQRGGGGLGFQRGEVEGELFAAAELKHDPGKSGEQDEAACAEIDGGFPGNGFAVLVIAMTVVGDHEEGGDEREFVEGVEEEDVGAKEGSEGSTGDQLGGDVVDAGLVRADLPDGGKGDKRGEQGEDERDTIRSDGEGDGGVVQHDAGAFIGKACLASGSGFELPDEAEDDQQIQDSGADGGGTSRGTEPDREGGEQGQEDDDFEGTHSGRRSMTHLGQDEDGEVDDEQETCTEEEGVALEVAAGEHTSGGAEALGRKGGEAGEDAIDENALQSGDDPGDAVLEDFHEHGVEFIEVELVSEDLGEGFGGERVAVLAVVEDETRAGADDQSQNRGDEDSAVGLGVVGLESFQHVGGPIPWRDDGEDSEEDEWQEHHDRCFGSVMSVLGAGFAEEGNDEHPRHVESGEQGGGDADPEERGTAGHFKGDTEDGFFAPEAAGKVRHTHERCGADGEGGKGDGHVFGQAAHLPDVLLVMAGVNDGTGAEEEHGFEEGMRVEVEHRRMAGSGGIVMAGGLHGDESDSHDHVAELRERGVGEHALDVVLLRGDQRGHEGGDAADPSDGGGGVWGGLDHESAADEHEHTGGDHGGGVDEGGDGRGALHGVRKPDVERELGAFSHGSHEDAERGDHHEGGVELRGVVHGALPEAIVQAGEADVAMIRHEKHQDADHETEVADAIGEESFLGGFGSVWLFKPVTDEQVGAETDQFPEDEHHHKVPREDDASHGEHEEGQGTEEALLGFVVLHVTDGEEMHEEADGGDDEHHATALLIDQRINGDAELADFDEGEEHRGGILGAEQHEADEETDGRREDGDHHAGTFEHAMGKQDHQRGKQRQEEQQRRQAG